MQAPRDVSLEWRKEVIRDHTTAPLAIVSFLWIGVGLRAAFDFDPIAWWSDKEPSSVVFYLVMALAGTIFCGFWCWITVGNALDLGRNGVEIFGRVESISILSAALKVPVRYAYEYEGNSYFGAVDLDDAAAKALSVGAPFRLIIHPDEPERSLPFDFVFPLKLKTADEDIPLPDEAAPPSDEI